MILLTALGVTIAVDLADSGLDHTHFRALWQRCLTDDDQPVTTVTLHPGSTYEGATQTITRAFIAARQGQVMMLHAGAVAHPRSGRAVAFIAPGGTGKSTLTRRLASRYGYLTDETVAFDPATLEIFPYPKPVTLALPGETVKSEHSPSELGLVQAPAHPKLSALAILRRNGGDEPTFEEPDLLDYFSLIAAESSSLAKLPKPLHLLKEIRERLGCTLITYRESSTIEDWFITRLEQQP